MKVSKNKTIIQFGKRLKELRLNNNYSGETLCELYNSRFEGNLNKGTLSKYENGVQEPSFTTVVTLADFFNVSIENMIGRRN